MTDDIDIIKKHQLEEISDLLLDSEIFVTKKVGDKFSGYLSDGILREDLSCELLSYQINETAHIYDIINLNIEK